jgi:hypothetical protein
LLRHGGYHGALSVQRRPLPPPAPAAGGVRDGLVRPCGVAEYVRRVTTGETAALLSPWAVGRGNLSGRRSALLSVGLLLFWPLGRHDRDKNRGGWRGRLLQAEVVCTYTVMYEVLCVGVSVLPGEAQMRASHRSSSSPSTYLDSSVSDPDLNLVLLCAIISRACLALLASLTVAVYKYTHLLCETRPPCCARGRQEHAACQKTMRSAAQTQAPKPWGIPSHGGVGVKMRPTPFDPMCRGRTTPPLLSRCCFHLRSQTGGAPDHECTPSPTLEGTAAASSIIASLIARLIASLITVRLARTAGATR